MVTIKIIAAALVVSLVLGLGCATTGGNLKSNNLWPEDPWPTNKVTR